MCPCSMLDASQDPTCCSGRFPGFCIFPSLNMCYIYINCNCIFLSKINKYKLRKMQLQLSLQLARPLWFRGLFGIPLCAYHKHLLVSTHNIIDDHEQYNVTLIPPILFTSWCDPTAFTPWLHLAQMWCKERTICHLNTKSVLMGPVVTHPDQSGKPMCMQYAKYTCDKDQPCHNDCAFPLWKTHTHIQHSLSSGVLCAKGFLWNWLWKRN